MTLQQQNQKTQLQEQTKDLEPQTAQSINQSFLPFFEKVEAWKDKAQTLIVTDETQVELMKQAREARLMLKSYRIEADKKRKELKADSIRYGKAVQGAYNILEYMIKPIEEHLLTQERFKEIKQAEMEAQLREDRLNQIRELQNHFPRGLDLGKLSQDDFDKMLRSAEFNFHEEQKEKLRIEQERIEAERKRAEEQERIRLENIRLKQEAKKRAEEQAKIEALRKKEEEKRQAKIREQQEAERRKREALEAKLRKERGQAAEKERIAKEKEQKLQEKLRKEQEEKRLLEEQRILAAKRKAKAEKQKLEEELKKNDAQKLQDLLNDLNLLKNKYTFTSNTYTLIYVSVGKLIDKVVNYVKSKA